jgi:hypothetical protein
MNVAGLVYALAWPLAFAFTWPAISRAWRPGWSRTIFGEAWACGGLGVVLAFAGQWPENAIGVVQVAIGAWLWRRGRRGRKRAPRAYGAKSRALVAALVTKAREAAKPRPVLRPVPGRACYGVPASHPVPAAE